MAGKAGGQSGLAKNPKKTKQKPDDDDLLDDLVTETEPDKMQPSYSKLQPGGFVMKGAGQKDMQMDQRKARIAAEAGELDNDGDRGRNRSRKD